MTVFSGLIVWPIKHQKNSDNHNFLEVLVTLSKILLCLTDKSTNQAPGLLTWQNTYHIIKADFIPQQPDFEVSLILYCISSPLSSAFPVSPGATTMNIKADIPYKIK